jgi:hypothetical protein
MEILRERSVVDLQHVLAARAQLKLLARLVAEHRWPVVVLKGGAAVLDGEELDVADVDVLVRPEHAQALARLVEERAGHRAAGSDGAVNGHKVFHLAQRVQPGSLPLEIHFRLSGMAPAEELWTRAVRVDSWGGTWRLAPADHLWHLLVHSSVSHVYKRGCLRDLLLVGAALERCSAGEIREVEGRIPAHSHARTLERVLGMARALRLHARPVDHFAGVAAGHYLLRAHVASRGLPYPFVLALSSATFALIEGDGEYRRLWSAARALPDVPSDYGSAAWLERRSRRLGRTARTALRVGGLASATLLAWPVAAAARRLAGRVG